MKIAIIGMGHMGTAIFKGLVNSGFKKADFILSNNSEDNSKAAKIADLLIISVKPLVVRKVLEDIKDEAKDKLVMSVAAGVSVKDIQRVLGKNQKIIRLMPNIPVAINQGVVGIYFTSDISENLKVTIKKLLVNLGMIIEVKNEDDLDRLMLIAGCGPAIASYFMSILKKNLEGLDSSDKIVTQAFKGTISYLEKNDLAFEDLINMVATKGGITEEIIKSLNQFDFKKNFAKSIQKGYSKLNKLKNEIQ